MVAYRVGWFRILRLDGFITTLPERPRFLEGKDMVASCLIHRMGCSERSYRLWFGRKNNKRVGDLCHLSTSLFIERIRLTSECSCSYDFRGENPVSRVADILKGGDTYAIFLNLRKEVIPA